MQTYDNRPFRLLRADANAVGGFLNDPAGRILPTFAQVSLPPVGGIASAHAPAFSLDGLISFRSARTHVTGRQNPADGSHEILVTSVVEGLNILEVVRAERLTTQVALTLPATGGGVNFSIAGTCFEGLRLLGRDTTVKLNPRLQHADSKQRDAVQGLTLADCLAVGKAQAINLQTRFEPYGQEVRDWVARRYGWMERAGRSALCSLVEDIEAPGLGPSAGHIVNIPQFGRFFFGELLVTHSTVQLLAVRAELGCSVRGSVTVDYIGGGGEGNEDQP